MNVSSAEDSLKTTLKTDSSSHSLSRRATALGIDRKLEIPTNSSVGPKSASFTHQETSFIDLAESSKDFTASFDSLRLKELSNNKFFQSQYLQALEGLSTNTFLEYPQATAWKLFIDASIPSVANLQDAFDLECAMQPLCASMYSTNFSTLLLLLLTELRRMRNVAYQGSWSKEALNALFGVRVFSKHFIETLSRQQLFDMFESIRDPAKDISSSQKGDTSPIPSDGASPVLSNVRRGSSSYIDANVVKDKRRRSHALLEELLQALVYAQTDNSVNYEFYVEILNTLLVLISSQLSNPAHDRESDMFLNLVFAHLSHFSRGLVGRFLLNFSQQQPQPNEPTSSVFVGAFNMLFASSKDDSDKLSLMGDKSVLVLLMLCGQGRFNDKNVYRDALSLVVDANGVASSHEAIQEPPPIVDISFKSLYTTIITKMDSEEACLLLYLLLLKNRDFRIYVSSQTEPDKLLLPILKKIYTSIETKHEYSHMYVLLTILLILSQDKMYCEFLQKVMVQPPQWFTERLIRSMQLGGMVFLVLIRVIQCNVSKHRDVYFHTTSLAILGNIAATISDINLVVAQRLVSLYESVAKRMQKLAKSYTAHDDDVMNPSASPTENDLGIEVRVYSDVFALILEIINAILSKNLKTNPQMVYAILHKKDMFTQFRLQPRFSDLIENIETVVSYFNARVLEADLKPPATFESVLAVIRDSGSTWLPYKLKVFQQVAFQYEEEVEYERFFIPYVWGLVYKHGLIYWSPEKLKLLNTLNLPMQDVPF